MRRPKVRFASNVLFNVMKKRTIPRIWSRLESIYNSKFLTNKPFLIKQLYSLKMAENSELLEHLNEFNKIVMQLLALEVKI